MYADGFKNLMKILSKFLFPSNFVYKCNNKIQRNWGSINTAMLKPQIGVQYKDDDKPNNGVQ